MFKNEEIRALWSQTQSRVWEGHFWMVSYALDRNNIVAEVISNALADSNYHSMIRDRHEIALIVHESIWNKYRIKNMHTAEFGPLAGITFDVPLDIEISGYLAPMVKEMADKGISIVPQCSLIYDHIFVRSNELSVATEIVKSIQSRALENKLR